MSKLRSKIDFKPTTKDAYDSPKNNILISDEFGQWGAVDLPKGFINFKKIGVIDKEGKVTKLRFAKPKKQKMKVFKFYCGELYYAYAALTKEEAIAQFIEETGDQYTVCEEIPESEWDEKRITMYEDNDIEKNTWQVSIREAIFGTDPHMIFTNDSASW